LKELR